MLCMQHVASPRITNNPYRTAGRSVMAAYANQGSESLKHDSWPVPADLNLHAIFDLVPLNINLIIIIRYQNQIKYQIRYC